MAAKKRSSGRKALTAIIDIGSNSVRMVAYNGGKQVFSEKINCKLAEDLGATGRLNPEARSIAESAIIGFVHIARAMRAGRVVAIATSAVRDARDGAQFLRRLDKRTGLKIRLVSGEEEARLAAQGVLSQMPKARGIVADLGGGSLDIARLKGKRVTGGLSMPLGTLRLLGHGRRGVAGVIEDHMLSIPASYCTEDMLYLVGGSFRAIGRLHMKRAKKSKPLQGYSISREQALRLCRQLRAQKPVTLTNKYDIDPCRAKGLPVAARLMESLIMELGVKKVVFSTAGLREGVLKTLTR